MILHLNFELDNVFPRILLPYENITHRPIAEDLLHRFINLVRRLSIIVCAGRMERAAPPLLLRWWWWEEGACAPLFRFDKSSKPSSSAVCISTFLSLTLFISLLSLFILLSFPIYLYLSKDLSIFQCLTYS